MRVLWSGLILLSFLLSNAEASADSPLPFPKIMAGQIGGGIRNHCSDSALSLKGKVVEILSLMRDKSQAQNLQRQFNLHLMTKTKCALEIMFSVLGPDFRLETLASAHGEKIQGAFQRIRNDYAVMAETHPTAKAMLIFVDHIRAEADRAKTEGSAQTLQDYFNSRMAELQAEVPSA